MDSLIHSLLSLGPWVVGLVVVAIVVLPQTMRILREYERAVIFRLGKLIGAKGPGVVFLVPFRRPHGQNGPARRHH